MQVRVRSLNLCFSTTDGLLSQWIRWYTASPVSHAVITFRSELLDKVMVMEAHGSGYRVVPWRLWERENTLTTRFTIDLPQDVQLEALQRMADHIGAAYDTRGLFGFVPRFRERVRVRARNALDTPDKLFCSEAVATFLAYAGFAGFDQPCDWSPADLYEWARSHGQLREVPFEANTPRTQAKMKRARSSKLL